MSWVPAGALSEDTEVHFATASSQLLHGCRHHLVHVEDFHTNLSRIQAPIIMDSKELSEKLVCIVEAL